MAENQKDLVLSPNEYAYVLDETKGNVQCNVGPHKMSLSQSDKLVKFDSHRKRFITVDSYREAIQLFTICPEGWYIALKNPVEDNRHPQAGTSNAIPEKMKIGCKVNIPGPASFALYPGQMAEVIKGHTLRSNQYLVARVYDAESLNATKVERGANETEPNFINGQILIIKGTECPFYIPPSGIEVKAINNDPQNGYVRNAVTLERLEYCILKDEDGNKRYVHGPDVVFPEPTETFVDSPKGGYVFRAIELSKISGIYVKVIAEYAEGDKVHPVGEELFITGDMQMIYYPRPEHAIISYDNKIMHHAIAIPEGEGRYIMNRLTGKITTVKGPAMYLPDPRFEVVVKRKLTARQCELWYPGNVEALQYNLALTEKSVEKSLKSIDVDEFAYFTAQSDASMMANLEAKANISRGTSYTKPRTITLDNKYDGVVAVDVWTGYAINVISKNGNREVVCGPQTVLLDYDQTLEMLELSTGKPKTTDNLQRVVFLRYENNRVSDVINVETSDFVSASVKVSYLVNFDKTKSDKWFSVDNYVKHLTDWVRSNFKKAARKYTISDFCDKYQDILIASIKQGEENENYLHYFDENGMYISDVEILSLAVEGSVQELIDNHQRKLVSRALDLKAATTSAETEKQIIELNRQKVELQQQFEQYKAEQIAETDRRVAEIRIAEQKLQDEEDLRQRQVEQHLQTLKDEIAAAAREREKLDNEQKLIYAKAKADIEAAREAQAAEAMKNVLTALGPDLAAALTEKSNQAIVEAITGAIAPYAIAKGESVSTAVDRLVRGSALEGLIEQISNRL